jgi:hypothetical protein
MEKLPLEMKQRICSFLHDSPKLLKPIRRVSKNFAAVAAPYLIPRTFLFDAQSRMRWLVASRKYDAAVQKVTKELKDSHEHHWKA